MGPAKQQVYQSTLIVLLDMLSGEGICKEKLVFLVITKQVVFLKKREFITKNLVSVHFKNLSLNQPCSKYLLQQVAISRVQAKSSFSAALSCLTKSVSV